jgi:DNA-binding GntR family transcriptional regulator
MQQLGAIWARRIKSLGYSEMAHRTLREGILDQVLPPGTRLAEEEIAERFGISRTPVREAILRLEAEGLAGRNSGRAAFVTDLSPDEIIEIYEVRAVIDGLAAELAATRIRRPGLSSLEWLNGQIKDAGERGDLTAMKTLNFQFHDEVAAASGNGFLREMMQQVHDRVRRFPGTTFAYPGRWEAVIAEHDNLLEVLSHGDAAGAFATARKHMLASRDIRIAMIER